MLVDKDNLTFFNIKAHALRGKTFFKGILEYRNKILPLHKYRIQMPNKYQCVLCGSNHGELLLEWEEGYQIYQCQECGAASPNISGDIPSKHIEEVYQTELYQKKIISEIHNQYEYRKNEFGSERYRYVIERLGLQHEKIKLLDVGCGAGYFLSYLKDKGVQSKGLEVTQSLVEYCQTQGINVQSTDVEEEPDNEYDVIVMFDVLEHLYDPVLFINSLKNKLKENGYIVAYTPNIYSVAYELMGALQNTLLPFEHVCFFDGNSFSFLAEKTGMKIYSLETYGFDIMDYLLMKEYEDDFPYTEKLHKLMVWLQAYLDKEGVSNHFRLTLKK